MKQAILISHDMQKILQMNIRCIGNSPLGTLSTDGSYKENGTKGERKRMDGIIVHESVQRNKQAARFYYYFQ
jgi:hypothetical protein